MGLESRKLKIIEQIIKIDNEAVLDEIISILKKEKKIKKKTGKKN